MRLLSNNSACSVSTRAVSATSVVLKEVLALALFFAGLELEEGAVFLLAEGLVEDDVRRDASGKIIEGWP